MDSRRDSSRLTFHSPPAIAYLISTSAAVSLGLSLTVSYPMRLIPTITGGHTSVPRCWANAVPIPRFRLVAPTRSAGCPIRVGYLLSQILLYGTFPISYSAVSYTMTCYLAGANQRVGRVASRILWTILGCGCISRFSCHLDVLSTCRSLSCCRHPLGVFRGVDMPPSSGLSL